MKQAAIIILIAVMIFSLCGCATSGSKNTNDAVKDSSSTKTEDTTASKESVASSKPIPVTFFGRFTNAPIDGNDPVIERLMKDTNLDITFIANPASNYQERLQIMLASGEYPDLVTFPSHNDQTFLDAVNNGVVVPINEYLKNAPELYNAIKEISWNAMKVKGDDKIYGVPQPTAVRFDGFITRKDWCDKLGLKIPEDGQITIEEFENIMKLMTENDPDGNGRKDTYGLTAGAGSNGEIGVILGNTFGLKGWQEYDNEEYRYMDLKFSRVSDNFKQALEFTRRMWAAGYIDPNWASNKGADIPKTRFKQGVAGMVQDFSGYTFDFEAALKENYPEAECTYITGVKDKDGKVSGAVSGTGYYWLSAITTTAAGKEQAIIDYLKYIVTDGWDIIVYGLEGIHYTRDAQGNRIMTEEYNKYTTWRGVFKLVMPADDLDYWIPDNLPPEKQEKVRTWLNTCIGNAELTLDEGFRPPAADNPEFIDYQSRMSEVIAKIIIGELPVNAWDECLEGWYKAGGKEYVEQMNEYIASRRK